MRLLHPLKGGFAVTREGVLLSVISGKLVTYLEAASSAEGRVCSDARGGMCVVCFILFPFPYFSK